VKTSSDFHFNEIFKFLVFFAADAFSFSGFYLCPAKDITIIVSHTATLFCVTEIRLAPSDFPFSKSLFVSGPLWQ
jgi:hypothetical protein